MVSNKLFLIFLAVAYIYQIGLISAEIEDPVNVTCPTEDALLPHENCSYYYQCVNWTPTVQQCPGGLYFSPATGNCEFPFDVPECVGGTRPPPGTTSNPITNNPTTSDPITNEPTTADPVTNNPTTSDPVTNSPTSDPVTNSPTADPVTNSPTADPVTNSPTADPVTNGPTTADPVTNGPTTSDPGTDGPTTSDPVTNGPTTSDPVTNGPTTSEPVTESPFCPPTGVHDFPYPGNCSLFIRCISGEPYVQACAESLLFDSIDRVCKPAADAVCEEEVATTTEAPEFTCPAEGYETFPHKSNCSLYYLCYNGQLFVEGCAAGTYYDATPSVKRCNLAELAYCNSECPNEGIHYLPIPTRGCQYYKICFNGDSANLSCANGTLYSPDQQACVTLDAYTCPYTI